MYCFRGFKIVDFKDKDSGNRIHGLTVYCSFPDDNVTGEMCDKFFFPLSKFEDVCNLVEVGSVLDISYNRFGKVDKIAIIQ